MVNELLWLDQIHPLARVKGKDTTATALLQSVDGSLPVQIRPANSSDLDTLDDYAQIDPALAVARPAEQADDLFVDPPPSQLGYAGYSAQQRYRFLRWLRNPLDAAPVAFQRLFLAQLECALLEKNRRAAAHRLLRHLDEQAHWHSDLFYRSLLLAEWLEQDSAGLAGWLARSEALPTPLFDLALGHLALLDYPLNDDLLETMIRRWALAESTSANGEPATNTVFAHRLASLRAATEQEPLAWSLAQLRPDTLDGESPDKSPDESLNESPNATQLGTELASNGFYLPWRTTHRDLRLALPQPILRPLLEPLLREVLSVHEPLAIDQTETQEAAGAVDEQWLLVLEFGQSRSDYFDYALSLARKRNSFAQIMDEKRQMVYRVVYRKREMRHFWRLWEYAQNWADTRVYLNGNELQTWQIWRYSQYLR